MHSIKKFLFTEVLRKIIVYRGFREFSFYGEFYEKILVYGSVEEKFLFTEVLKENYCLRTC